jgi:ubiquinone biosynthesis protein UbiJ
MPQAFKNTGQKDKKVEYEILTTIIVSIVSAWFGLLEYRMRKMQNKLDKCLTDEQTDKLIDLKQEPIKSKQDDVKEDIKRVEAKLDKLIEMQMNRN